MGTGPASRETHQFNLRLVYSTDGIGDLGASFQYGMLKGKNVDDDGAGHYAVSGHAKTPIGDFTLFSQITYYEYDITDDTPWGTGELIPMGGLRLRRAGGVKGGCPGPVAKLRRHRHVGHIVA